MSTDLPTRFPSPMPLRRSSRLAGNSTPSSTTRRTRFPSPMPLRRSLRLAGNSTPSSTTLPARFPSPMPLRKSLRLAGKSSPSSTTLRTRFPSPMLLRRSPRFPGNSAHSSTHHPPTCALPLPTSPNQKTIFLDLDHTLICAWRTSQLPPRNYDFLVKFKSKHHSVRYVKKRPYVDEFLKYLSQKNFEIVVFTYAEESYASATLDKLDPNGLISHRLYRKSCKILDGMSVKDLSDLGRDLKNVVIIDDKPTSYRLQPENAIPITPFFDDLQDNELKKLMDDFFDKCDRYKDLKDALKHYMGVKNSKQERETEAVVLKTNPNNIIQA